MSLIKYPTSEVNDKITLPFPDQFKIEKDFSTHLNWTRISSKIFVLNLTIAYIKNKSIKETFSIQSVSGIDIDNFPSDIPIKLSLADLIMYRNDNDFLDSIINRFLKIECDYISHAKSNLSWIFDLEYQTEKNKHRKINVGMIETIQFEPIYSQNRVIVNYTFLKSIFDSKRIDPLSNKNQKSTSSSK